MVQKTILFLSALDFKEKSIQVIRKTPEFYFQNGWEVHYVVLRDTSLFNNYYYEKVIDPKGINITRIILPFAKIQDCCKSSVLKKCIAKVRGYIGVFLLAYYGRKTIKQNKINVIYGYETHGVLASNLLKLFGVVTKKHKLISRFQGTWIFNFIMEKNI